MFQSREFSPTLSMKLSEVMEDIGLNEELVTKGRSIYSLRENIHTLTLRSSGMDVSVYYLGSQPECTRTIGLDSDLDIVFVYYDINVMQDMSDWKQNKVNYLVVQDENVSSGYCFLQLYKSDVSLPAAKIEDEYHVRDSKGRILLRNTMVTGLRGDAERQGPSNAVSGTEGYSDMDFVLAYPCNSWPQSTSHFLEGLGIRWPSHDLIRKAASNKCFVVGASSKTGKFPHLEWRISTTLAERCLMYDLNITQIQCYVLMKMILKVFLNPRKENGLSSFMCKTVLFHCIENSEHAMWAKNNLWSCLTFCLLKLQSYIQSESCPHFIIPVNNLMAGQFPVEVKCNLAKTINDIIDSDGRCLLRIQYDGIGDRLQAKLNTSLSMVYGFFTRREMNEYILKYLFYDIAESLSDCLLDMYLTRQHGITLEDLRFFASNLTFYRENGNRPQQTAAHYLATFIFSTLGTALASSCICQNNPVPHQAFTLLSMGLDSDVTSGRLKLASVLYCTGDLYKAESLLRQTEKQYDSRTVLPICKCWRHKAIYKPAEFEKKCIEQGEDCFRQNTAFCVRFLPIEVKCIPRELQYEMCRSTKEDKPYRSKRDVRWMNFAVIDSLPYLYFLQYKTYGHLKRPQDQQRALKNLEMFTLSSKKEDFCHIDTAFNLLGQCMEQEDKPSTALKYYMLSLQQRYRNNAAKIHICSLLAKFACQK